MEFVVYIDQLLIIFFNYSLVTYLKHLIWIILQFRNSVSIYVPYILS